MTRALALLLMTAMPALSTAPATAQEVPGLISARLLPGWTEGSARIIALELTLQPGWKTYWRNPGDSGMPPHFDWGASRNLAAVEALWPAPEVFWSGGERTLGYHERLVLPLRVTLTDPEAPAHLQAVVEFGLCEDICVPAVVTLTAPPVRSAPDPAITAALARQPVPAPGPVACAVEPIADGLRITTPAPADQHVVLDFADPMIWVSAPVMQQGADGPVAVFEAVAPSGKPFSLRDSPASVLMLGAAGAEVADCAAPDRARGGVSPRAVDPATPQG